jgi:beta-phosphoglucomutase-like phosphatase (HAD superfamily)
VRIAIDIDSTLHHYWDELAGAAKRRFGVELPYEHQHTWRITRLRDEQLRAAIADTHSDAAIARARPYPHAVETVNAWHAAGHFIQISSQRAERCHAATARWLADIGLEHDDLCCSRDKIGRCIELDIDLLIDDSPVNLQRALEAGMIAATLVHPWNREVCEEEDVVSARDWPALAAELERRCSLRRRAA